MIRPRKLLYLAIDGVAPRAKMNQQRSRRFRTASDEAQAALDGERVRQEMRESGLSVKERVSAFDKNVITPGTGRQRRDFSMWSNSSHIDISSSPRDNHSRVWIHGSNYIYISTPYFQLFLIEFMFGLAEFIRFFVLSKINSSDPYWKNLTVIFSDASVPGEGEHKIIQFIREQRLKEGYNPNATHCIYGLDADLIMLTLATHEPHFTVLREEVDNKKAKGGGGHVETTHSILANYKPFELFKVYILRQYLELVEFPVTSFRAFETFAFPFDFESIVDDFVFLCMFVGNDFLPHLPSLEIREGALEVRQGPQPPSSRPTDDHLQCSRFLTCLIYL